MFENPPGFRALRNEGQPVHGTEVSAGDSGNPRLVLKQHVRVCVHVLGLTLFRTKRQSIDLLKSGRGSLPLLD